MHITILGGGAAGFFAAISCEYHHPQAKILLLEKTGKLLSKVKISGGGRCNVTHQPLPLAQLVKNYPRGGRELRPVFLQFGIEETMAWFEQRGVRLKIEDSGCVFPVSDYSQSIIDCLLREVEKNRIEIRTQVHIINVQQKGNLFHLECKDGSEIKTDKLIIATGGNAKPEFYQWIQNLGHTIIPPVPSLFTFNMPGQKITELMGVSVPKVKVWIEATKLEQMGSILITHWGLSGPAILKLSAWGARILHEMNYQCTVHVNWLGEMKEDIARQFIEKEIQEAGMKKIFNSKCFALPQRLWIYLCELSGIDDQQRWVDLKRDSKNKLLHYCTNHSLPVQGKTTFKEEFVTAGGVALLDVDMHTMQSKKCPGIYFAGEVLDIDGVTGGFNFQAAWSTGWVSGMLKENV